MQDDSWLDFLMWRNKAILNYVMMSLAFVVTATSALAIYFSVENKSPIHSTDGHLVTNNHLTMEVFAESKASTGNKAPNNVYNYSFNGEQYLTLGNLLEQYDNQDVRMKHSVIGDSVQAIKVWKNNTWQWIAGWLHAYWELYTEKGQTFSPSPVGVSDVKFTQKSTVIQWYYTNYSN